MCDAACDGHDGAVALLLRGGENMSADERLSVGGEVVEFTIAIFGPQTTRLEVPVLAVATQPVLADAELTNAMELAKKVAVVRRGGAAAGWHSVCQFHEKARRAQEAGAVAVVCINDGQRMIRMGDPDNAAGDINIPCVMVSKVDGDRLLLPDSMERAGGSEPVVQLAYDNTLLMTAKNGHALVVHRLLSAGAAVNTRHHGEISPLLLAAQNGHEAVVDRLIVAGAAVDTARTDNGATPLLFGRAGGPRGGGGSADRGWGGSRQGDDVQRMHPAAFGRAEGPRGGGGPAYRGWGGSGQGADDQRMHPAVCGRAGWPRGSCGSADRGWGGSGHS